MGMILSRDSAKKIHFSTDWSKHYIFLNITVNYRLSNDAITECGSQHLNCILLIFFRKWGQLVTHHLIMFCCDWLVFNSYDWRISYSTGWITKALLMKHYFLFHTYTLLCQGRAHKVHFHAAKCSDIWAGFRYLARMGLADMMGGCGTIPQEQVLAVRWHSLSGKGKIHWCTQFGHWWQSPQKAP